MFQRQRVCTSGPFISLPEWRVYVLQSPPVSHLVEKFPSFLFPPPQMYKILRMTLACFPLKQERRSQVRKLFFKNEFSASALIFLPGHLEAALNPSQTKRLHGSESAFKWRTSDTFDADFVSSIGLHTSKPERGKITEVSRLGRTYVHVRPCKVRSPSAGAASHKSVEVSSASWC